MNCNYYITKSNRNCKKLAKCLDTLTNLSYCTLHYNLLFNNIDSKKDSNNTKFTKDSNNTKFTKDSNNTEFTKNNNNIDLKKDSKIKKNNTKSKDNIIEKCIYIKTTNKICNKKSHILYDNNYYCKNHYNTILLLKKKEIDNEIKRIENITINDNNKSILKKDIYKILLTIHPDKCKIPNIDSHLLTQKLTDILNKLKI